jgi:hypothetical protein
MWGLVWISVIGALMTAGCGRIGYGASHPFETPDAGTSEAQDSGTPMDDDAGAVTADAGEVDPGTPETLHDDRPEPMSVTADMGVATVQDDGSMVAALTSSGDAVFGDRELPGPVWMIADLSPEGDVRWFHSATMHNSSILDVSHDLRGNVWVTTINNDPYSNTYDLGGGPLTVWGGVFVVVYRPDGTVHFQQGKLPVGNIHDVVVEGDRWCTGGWYTGTDVSLGGETLPPGENDAFAYCTDLDGGFLRQFVMAGPGTGTVQAVDVWGTRLVLAGTASGVINVAGEDHDFGVLSGFVSAYDTSTGELEWIKVFEGDDTSRVSVSAVAIDPSNQPYLAGHFANVTLDGRTVPEATLVALDALGDLRYRQFTGTWTSVQAASTDDEGHLYVAGTATTDFELGGVSLAAEWYTGWVAALSENGEALWTDVRANADWYDERVALDVSPSGVVSVVRRYETYEGPDGRVHGPGVYITRYVR